MEATDSEPTTALSGQLERVTVVLVGTTHPGNIGATARAMKVMGLSRLALVDPRHFPHADATARAAGADDILARATVHAELPTALADCEVVYGTTARTRHLDWPTLSPRAAAARIAADGASTAILFGRERTGLTNAELDRCQYAINIDTAPDYRSLNLAQAVQICAYEYRLACLERVQAEAAPPPHTSDKPASAAELERLRQHCLEVMARVRYHDPARPKLLDRRLRRLFSRADLRHSEAQILRGLLSAVEMELDRLTAAAADNN